MYNLTRGRIWVFNRGPIGGANMPRLVNATITLMNFYGSPIGQIYPLNGNFISSYAIDSTVQWFDPSSTPTVTASPTSTRTAAATGTPSGTGTPSPSGTGSTSNTATSSLSPGGTPSITSSGSTTGSNTASASITSSNTPSNTVTPR